MLHAANSRLPGLLCGFLLLLPVVVQAQTPKLYRVEMLIFSYPGGGSAEKWEATPILAYPRKAMILVDPEQASAPHQEPAAPPESPEAATELPDSPALFTTLPASDLNFRAAAARMQRDGRYRLLFHQAWIQPIPSRYQALPVVLDRSGDGGPWPALQGSVTLYISRYIYLETNLWLNTSGDYLHSAWRMPPPPLGPPTPLPDGEVASAPGTPPPQPDGQPGAMQAQVMPDLSGSLPGEDLAEPEYPYAHAVLLHQTRRMRSGEVNYIDHPLLGVVVKVTPVKPATVSGAG